ncbi:MAG: methyltransferase domain-containing protein [Planctomycetota bacterium]|jgi:ubiquinone/menaquinone biosynthesis C-methylase UbiE
MRALKALATLLPVIVLFSCQAKEESVRPNINDRFLDPDMNVEELTQTFEVESREIFSERHDIVAALGLEPGMEVADIGAGTGLFLRSFSDGVGSDGLVYAVDISPKFVDHLSSRAREGGYSNVRPVLCSEDSADLPTASVDLAFICDTYHHFEFPRSTMASIRSAIRPGGELIVIDFERIPGVSREFIMGHVRAGKEVFTEEIIAAGFTKVEEVNIPGLSENYFIRFRRP